MQTGGFMKSKVAIFAVIGLALAMAPAVVSARSCDTVQGKSIPKRIAEKLNLTPEQQEQLKSLRKDMMESAKPLFEQMKSIRDKVKEELLKKEPSQQTLDDFAAQFGDLHKQLAQKFQAHLLK